MRRPQTQAPRSRGRAGRAPPDRGAPDFAHEARLAAATGGPVCGVDEVGRGPLAGPVFAAAAILDADSAAALLALGLTDSKALTPARIEALARRIEGWAGPGRILWALGAASVAEIERLNILRAAERAMTRAVARLALPPAAALIDGRRVPPELALPAEAVVGGDRRCLSIAAAAVVAKARRDALMRRLARRWPGYGWERNKGYGGAPAHRAGIAALGLTPHHRPSFCVNALRDAAQSD